MADQSNKDTYDIFIANSTYPDVKSVFARLQSLDQIKDDCFVVLDTNVLLTPYTIGQEDLLEQCRKIFKPLSSQKRLIIPGQVAREFAKHRANKLVELYQQLSRKQVPSMHRGKYPLLSSLEDYKEIVRLEEEIDKKLEEYKQAYKKAIDAMLSHIQEWRWNDPVTLLYSEIFDEDTIVDPPIDKEVLQRDLEHRLHYNIPPAYKDRAKDDSGIGDLLIWHTILEVGKSRKKSVIFVSGDEKSDWYLRSEGRALFPRYEIVDEFRRYSGGQTLHLVKFSYFLELFGASEKIVQQVQQEESLLQRQETIEKREEEIKQQRLAERARLLDIYEIEIFRVQKDLMQLKEEEEQISNQIARADIPGDTIYSLEMQTRIEAFKTKLLEIQSRENDLAGKHALIKQDDEILQRELAALHKQEEQTLADN